MCLNFLIRMSLSVWLLLEVHYEIPTNYYHFRLVRSAYLPEVLVFRYQYETPSLGWMLYIIPQNGSFPRIRWPRHKGTLYLRDMLRGIPELQPPNETNKSLHGMSFLWSYLPTEHYDFLLYWVDHSHTLSSPTPYSTRSGPIRRKGWSTWLFDHVQPAVSTTLDPTAWPLVFTPYVDQSAEWLKSDPSCPFAMLLSECENLRRKKFYWHISICIPNIS